MQTSTQENQDIDVLLDDDLSFLDTLTEELEAIEVDEEDDAIIGDVIREIETEEEMQKIYAEQSVEVIDRIVEVDGEVELEAESEVGAEAESEVEIAPTQAAKKPRVKKTGKVSERIANQLGADFIKLTTLSQDWAGKAPDKHTEDFAAIVDDMALYVSDKAVNLFKFLQSGGGLNEVTRRGFEVLIKDGQLVGGKSGNIMNNLLSKPYSMGTAASQSNQLIQLFTDLEICNRAARGTLIENPDSEILKRVKTLMGK